MTIILFSVLAVIKQSQAEHGLKHGDFQRYRQYCTKRLERIRKALNFVQSSGSKNRSTFVAKPVTVPVVFEVKRTPKDILRFLSIPLISAERCWAYAMQLKQEATSEPRKKFHMIRRFRKAVRWSVVLRDLCNAEASKCDLRTKLETTAYADYLNGLYFFEIDQWAKASELLSKAQNIYEKLFKVIYDEDILAHYKQRVGEIKPTLRYCAFNIGEGKGAVGTQDFINKIKTEVDGFGDKTISSKIEVTFFQFLACAISITISFQQLIDQSRLKECEELTEVEWLGKSVFVKHDKIRSFLLQLKDPSNDWQDLPLYERLIFECRDCLQLLRDINSDRSSLYQYLTYLRLDLITKRNLALVATLQNPADILRQYESIIGGYNEIKQLPLGQYFTDDYLVEQFLAEIDAQITAFKAYRCYYIGLVAKQNWKESIALLDRAGFYAKEALKNEFITKKKVRKSVAMVFCERW